MILEKILEGHGKKVFKGVVYVAMGLLVIADFIIPKHHAIFPWDEIPGFSAVYGFISCVVIIVVSKFIGKVWLQKSEDYYD